jgi:hypothetical protein
MSEQPESDSSQVSRFVVLAHTDRQGTHFDLMIDLGEVLATWRCPRPPEEARESDLACVRLKDHRRHCLDYEGPVSGDRGSVQRHDRGTCVFHARTAERWEVTFEGQRLAGRFALESVSSAGDEYCLRSVPFLTS